MNMDSDKYLEWRMQATSEEIEFWNRFADFCDLFDDMCFAQGTAPHSLITYTYDDDSNNLVEEELPLPDQLNCFELSWFTTKIEDLGSKYYGCYNHLEQVFTISPNALGRDYVLLHELIHMFEDLLNELPLFYHDMLYWALYQNLRSKIDGLDEAITKHAHLAKQTSIYYAGGLHDVLFLLKSFDLDLRMGYPLGTVFGYGGTENFAYLRIKSDH